jgi:hypothetical protein
MNLRITRAAVAAQAATAPRLPFTKSTKHLTQCTFAWMACFLLITSRQAGA